MLLRDAFKKKHTHTQIPESTPAIGPRWLAVTSYGIIMTCLITSKRKTKKQVWEAIILTMTDI